VSKRVGVEACRCYVENVAAARNFPMMTGLMMGSGIFSHCKTLM
jgi:hypothetical protein